MLFYCTAVTAILLVIFNVAILDINSDNCAYKLNISNDGPVTLDVPVAVYAQLSCVESNTSFLYMFEDDSQRVIEADGHDTATASFLFTKTPGTHTIRVHVYLIHPISIKIATGETLVQVYEYIPGALELSGVVEDKDGHQYIGTGWETNITLEIHYPRHVLQESEFAYSWTLGDNRFTNDRSSVSYRFEEPGLKLIRVSVVGRIPTYDGTSRVHYKWGYFDRQVTVKDPFFSVNISGNTYLEHGQLLDLNINCNGSGPVDYCWKLLPTSENYTNLSCTDPVTSTECSVPILYYFRDSGNYKLAIYVSNLVSTLQRNVEVHIYDVSLRPQLSTVILPVVCTVMVVIIIAAAIIIQMRRHPSYNIETADFDFMKADEPSIVAVETSWERMWRSLVHLLQLRCLCHSADRETPAAVHYGTLLKEK